MILLLALLAIRCTDRKAGKGNLLFYVGSSDIQLEHPIFLVEMNPERGVFTVVDSFPGAAGPSYLAFPSDRQFLYSIDKRRPDAGSEEMSVSAFRVDPRTGALTMLNSRSSGGDGPCHVCCSSDGRLLFAANYTSGNIAVFPLSESGEIEPASCVVQGEGSGPDPARQDGPHAHQVMLDPRENYLLVPDLGADRILIFRVDHEAGTVAPNPVQPFLELEPGAGPRHLVFHPSGKLLFVVNELNATVTVCRYDGSSGTLTRLQSVRTVEESYHGTAYPAAIRMDPGGNYLYASTRGEVSSLAVFSLGEDGSIARIQVVEDVPGWPRDFNIDPSGRYLIVAGERSGTLELFHIDPESGTLSRTGIRTSLPAPGCILFTL